MPDKQKWKRFRIKKIWLRTDSYTKASQKCRLVAETSNLETEDTSNKKRQLKKPRRFQSETDISSDVSDLLLNEPQNLTEEATKNYCTKVLQRLQELCENQQDILSLQRSILAAVAVPGGEAEEEILAGPCQNVEAFKELDIALNYKEKRTKMMNYLRSLGVQIQGQLYAKCCVRWHRKKC
ncbi:uncharacterized protein LOC127624552 [Xyrauchen texanus]|uniref:uncharacterized protein LOC127624552 n=1 Tax=Xyrauchen texanus TaxID=154827 RepID=UPI0022429835|nr:uncharacterized protein LOC127624552 [Xyrauchen texanus]